MVHVKTPLDLIRVLENLASIATVVLADAFSGQAALASFLRADYPALRVITVHTGKLDAVAT